MIQVNHTILINKFSLNYKGGFAKLLRIDDIKKELQSVFKTPIDLVPDSNKSILKDLIHV